MAKTDQDPAGQRMNRRKAFNALKKRLDSSLSSVIREVDAISFTKVKQKKIANATITLYQYDLSGEEFDSLRLSIQSFLNRDFATVRDDMPLDWWYKNYVELPFRQGALESLNEISQLIESESLGSPAALMTTIEPQNFLLSGVYLDAVREAQVRNYGLIKTLSADTAKDVYLTLESGLQGGVPARDLRKQVRDRFGVAESNAKRIVATEVNRAYNDARLNATKVVNERMADDDREIAVLHISALLPTTRADHAARHGNAYTAEQQLRWWNEDANRINCHCTTRAVVFKGGKVVQSDLQKQIRDRRTA